MSFCASEPRAVATFETVCLLQEALRKDDLLFVSTEEKEDNRETGTDSPVG